MLNTSELGPFLEAEGSDTEQEDGLACDGLPARACIH
jgi:hypothetical protein